MSQQNFQTLAPKTSAILIAEAQREAQREAQEPASRAPVQIACQRCREKRAKCDGRQPCFRCQRAAADCLYQKRQRGLITDLLAEIDRLRRENAEKDKLLEAVIFSHDVETCKSMIQKLKDGNKSRQDILMAMDRKTRCNDFPDDNQGKRTIARELVNLDTGPSICPDCSCRIRPWNFYRSPGDFSRLAEATAALSAPGLPTPVSLPSLHVNEDAHQSQTDGWTILGLTRVYVRQLFSALVTWDCLPFCIVCEAPFMQSFDTGSSEFCSQALVNALLALAIRVIIETENETVLLPRNCLQSKQVFDDANRILSDVGQPSNVPDIQALGILSIYEISCGRKREAETFAQRFYSSITDLCDREPLADEEDETYVLVRTTAYCGAVSLLRIIRLACEGLSTHSGSILAADSICLDQSPCSIMSASECDIDLKSTNLGLGVHCSKLSGIQLIGAKIFQLTEWVYKFLSGPVESAPTKAALSEAISVYTKCLKWYDGFFSLLEVDGINTPSILFIHIYYHFCLLVLFRPFIGLAPDGSLLYPAQICAQSAQSLLSLAQSYDSLFTLRRISGFAPYLVLASGLISRALEDASSPMHARYVSSSDHAVPRVSSDLSGEEEMYCQHNTPHFSPSIKTSAVDHARLILEKLNSDLLVVLQKLSQN